MKKSLILCILFLGFSYVSAQSVTTTSTEPSTADLIKIQKLNYNASVNESDIDANVTPEFPGAYEKVSIRLDSNTVDLNRYLIQWTVNDVPKISGIGERDLQVTSPNYGEVLRVRVSVKLDSGYIQKSVIIAPQDITVLWEAVDSYVPPFYRGKKLPSHESLINISAIPNFQTGNNALKLNDAVYLWNRNGNKVLNVGGYGKDSLLIQHNRLRASENIAAEVSTVSGGSKAKQSVTIQIVDPEIHWYTKNISNYRRLTATDQGVRVNSGDVKLVAEPYFFSLNNKPSALTIDWKMNGQQLYLDPSSSNQEILVRNPNAAGQTNFSVNIINPKTFLQEASKALSVYFEKQSE